MFKKRTWGTELTIEGAADRFGAAIEDVGVDHGGFDVFMTEQFLDSADVIAIL
jgi:hypothetical protein